MWSSKPIRSLPEKAVEPVQQMPNFAIGDQGPSGPGFRNVVRTEKSWLLGGELLILWC